MIISEIEKILKENEKLLNERFRVKRIGVFGSFARGEQTELSDVDILVELYEPIGWDFVELKYFLEDLLGLPVDLVTNKALKPRIRELILSEVVYA